VVAPVGTSQVRRAGRPRQAVTAGRLSLIFRRSDTGYLRPAMCQAMVDPAAPVLMLPGRLVLILILIAVVGAPGGGQPARLEPATGLSSTDTAVATLEHTLVPPWPESPQPDVTEHEPPDATRLPVARADDLPPPAPPPMAVPQPLPASGLQPGDSVVSSAATVSPPVVVAAQPSQVPETADRGPERASLARGGMRSERTQAPTPVVEPAETSAPSPERDTSPSRTAVAPDRAKEADSLESGQPLASQPVAGPSHIVQDGETVAVLAERYGVDEATIRNHGPNGLGDSGEVRPGQALVIPGGRPPASPTSERASPTPEPAAAPIQAALAPEPVRSAPVAAAPATPQTAPTPIPRPVPPSAPGGGATGRMVWPATGQITTAFTYAGGRGHNGLDIANGFGTPIVAADGGVVTWAGWRNDGLGIAVFIDHGNGLQTWYGHLTRAVVGSGQRVSKGQTIGTMGSTGISSGSHLHFMVLQNNSYRNPLGYLP
jgi:murein DD-endopeptidase MepM/ murein hydrolase activator NlpD